MAANTSSGGGGANAAAVVSAPGGGSAAANRGSGGGGAGGAAKVAARAAAKAARLRLELARAEAKEAARAAGEEVSDSEEEEAAAGGAGVSGLKRSRSAAVAAGSVESPTTSSNTKRGPTIKDTYIAGTYYFTMQGSSYKSALERIFAGLDVTIGNESVSRRSGPFSGFAITQYKIIVSKKIGMTTRYCDILINPNDAGAAIEIPASVEIVLAGDNDEETAERIKRLIKQIRIVGGGNDLHKGTFNPETGQTTLVPVERQDGGYRRKTNRRANKYKIRKTCKSNKSRKNRNKRKNRQSRRN